MGDQTGIEWSDATWNPVTGCDRVSPGCAHCYALTLAKRLKAMGHPAYQQDGGPASGPGFAVQLHPDRLEAPLHWRQPRRVFVNSMSDLFHEDVPGAFIEEVFARMAVTPQHMYQILTKRPARMLEWFTTGYRDGMVAGAAQQAGYRHLLPRVPLSEFWPLPNVWLGVSVENQRMADERIPLLLQTPAAVRFLSCEPLLSRVDLARFLPAPDTDGDCARCGLPWQPDRDWEVRHECSPGFGEAGIDWVIVGGESGPVTRPFDPDWARLIRDDCAQSETPFFMKQLGGARPGSKLDDLPEDLRIRELPA